MAERTKLSERQKLILSIAIFAVISLILGVFSSLLYPVMELVSIILGIFAIGFVLSSLGSLLKFIVEFLGIW